MGREILNQMPPAANHVVPYGPDPNQFGELRLPDSGAKPFPVAVLIHGGYWRAAYDLKQMGHIGGDLRAYGVASWNIEYRRLGQAGGAWPAMGNDVRAAVFHLKALERKHALDLGRVIPIGFSAGGQLALWCAAEAPLPLLGAISLAGVADLRRAWELKLSGNVMSELMGGSREGYGGARGDFAALCGGSRLRTDGIRRGRPL